MLIRQTGDHKAHEHHGTRTGFVERIKALAGRTAWDWRRCPHCGQRDTHKNGSYNRHPWGLEGRKVVRVQRYWCRRCRRSYAEEKAWLVKEGWYTRAVHCMAIDLWQHLGGSLRRVAEFLRSLMGQQERWGLWQIGEQLPAGECPCHLSFATIQRWLDGAGQKAQESVAGQLEGRFF